VTALRIHRYYVVTGQQLALRPEDVKVPPQGPAPLAPRVPPGGSPAHRAQAAGTPGPQAAEHPGQISELTIVPVPAMDRATIRALAYAAALGQPVFALHISPTAEEADRFGSYWQTWGEHLPLEVIVSPHRAVVAPLVNYIWTLHQQRPDLTLTVTVPEVVDRHWFHRILLDRVARRLQRTLQALPGVIVTSVPFQISD
jgi:hypothetical protein